MCGSVLLATIHRQALGKGSLQIASLRYDSHVIFVGRFEENVALSHTQTAHVRTGGVWHSI